MRVVCSVELPNGALHDVVVDADEEATVARLREAISGATGADGGQLWLYDRLLDDADTLSASGVRNGVVLSTSGSTKSDRAAVADRGWQLHVIGGADAGTVFDLPIGEHTIGRTEGMVIDDRAVSRRHVRIDVTSDGASVIDVGSSNGSLLDGEPIPVEGVAPAVPIGPGQVLHIGDSLLAVRIVDPERAAMEPSASGLLDLTRPPRIRPPHGAGRISLPKEPGKGKKAALPWITVLIPLALSLAMYTMMGRQPMYLMFGLMSPVMAIGNWWSQRRQGGKSDKEQWAEYVEATEKANADIEAARVAETQRRRDDAPDLASLVQTAVRPGPRLWERRSNDSDFLSLRVGAAHQPAEFAVVDGSDEQHPVVQDVPALVELAEVGVLGVAGPYGSIRGIGRALVAQIAARHTPRDVRMQLLAAERVEADWGWVRWLPHLQGESADEPTAYVGNDSETTAKRIGELLELVKQRTSLVGNRAGGVAFSAVVVIFDGARALRAIPGVQSILQDGPSVGVYAICLEAEQRLLPEECRTVVVPDRDEAARVRILPAAGMPTEKVLADHLSVTHANDLARALAPVRDRGREDGDASLPDSARLLELLNLEDPSASAIRAGWTMGGRSTSFVLGAGIGGPFRLDVRSDGPHGLIAGTTGSGKSELLQTIIASLAVENRPDEMNFVLVDYKGGSAFKDCVKLPHTVGMVTDLDAHLVERALASLGAELKFREHQLAAIGAKDIEDYQELRTRDGGVPALPRLMIVIDEFASMVRDLPDFITGLVNIAQRGRSLGIHMLLATQRPSGAVSPEIRANTNLRMSLRVLDAGDSTDVLEAPDAARIGKSTPGRGYARLGHGALSPFQAGRVGGRRPGVRSLVVEAPYVAELGWGQVGYAPPRRPQVAGAKVDADDTDLAALVTAVNEAALGMPEQRRPWLDALPEQVLLSSLAVEEGDIDTLRPIVFGLKDLPGEQAQVAAAFDLDNFSHQFVVGGPKSGRTQFLRTVAAAVAQTTSASNVHIYALDCGASGLAPLVSLPHTGAVVGRNEGERAARLFARLASEIERRQGVLAAGNFADIAEQRRGSTPGDRLPHILFMIDRWEAFSTTIGQAENGRYAEQVLEMLREGASVGVHLLIAGDRSLASMRMSSLTENKMCLRLPDRSDYSMVGVPHKKVADEVPSGRGYEGDEALETQIALVVSDPEGAAQAAGIEQIGAEVAVRDAAVPVIQRPFRLDPTPTQIDYAAASAMKPVAAGPRWFMVGVGGDELTALGVDLAFGSPTFLIAGPLRSGRTTTLATLVRELTESGISLVVGAGRGGPFETAAGLPGVVGVVGVDTPAADWEALMAFGDGPLAVVLDDAEQFRECAGKDVLLSLSRGERADRLLIAAGSADGLAAGLSGWMAELRKAKRGLLLSPQDVAAGDLVGVRLARSNVGGSIQPGRGLLVSSEVGAVSVQVPMTPLESPALEKG